MQYMEASLLSPDLMPKESRSGNVTELFVIATKANEPFCLEVVSTH